MAGEVNTADNGGERGVDFRVSSGVGFLTSSNNNNGKRGELAFGEMGKCRIN